MVQIAVALEISVMFSWVEELSLGNRVRLTHPVVLDLQSDERAVGQANVQVIQVDVPAVLALVHGEEVGDEGDGLAGRSGVEVVERRRVVRGGEESDDGGIGVMGAYPH